MPQGCRVSRLAQVPTLKGAPVLGLWPALAHDVLDVLERARAVAGDLVRLATPGGPPLVVVKHPGDIRRVLVENAANYGRTPFHDRLKIALGDGLLNSEGELWARQRRRLQPLFHARALDGYAAMMAERGRALAERWRQAGAGALVEAERDLSHLALGIVSRALFGDEADHGDISEAVGITKAVVRPPPARRRPPRRRRGAGGRHRDGQPLAHPARRPLVAAAARVPPRALRPRRAQAGADDVLPLRGRPAHLYRHGVRAAGDDAGARGDRAAGPPRPRRRPATDAARGDHAAPAATVARDGVAAGVTSTAALRP